MNNLRKFRKEQDISQLQLSRMSGVASNVISNIENDKIYAYPGWQNKIAKALNVPKEEIFPGGEKNESR